MALDVQYHDQATFWPADEPLDLSTMDPPYDPFSIPADDAWRLEMLASGHLVLRSPDDKTYPGAIEVYRHARPETLKRTFILCRQGYERDDTLIRQDGVPYIFNWVTGTLFQLHLATKIIHLYLAGTDLSIAKTNEGRRLVDLAWTTGRMAEELASARAARDYIVSGERPPTGVAINVPRDKSDPLLSADDPRLEG